jgi:hypothetical protein
MMKCLRPSERFSAVAAALGLALAAGLSLSGCGSGAGGASPAGEPGARQARPAGGAVVRLQRWTETREDPSLGPTNSVGAKIDFAVKRDAAGSAMLHWFANYTYKDPRAVQGMFPVGSNYMGAVVYPVPTAENFLNEFVFGKQRPQAQSVEVLERRALPELVARYRQKSAVAITQFDAAAVTVRYTENGVRYREKMMAVIELVPGAGLGLWTNHDTLAVRAPDAEFDALAGLMSVVEASLKGNPAWVAGENSGAAQRAQSALNHQRYMQDQMARMMDDKRAAQAEIRHSSWLFLTAQDDYINPHTGAVEQGSNQYKHRWENSNGDVIYTDDAEYDPSRDDRLRGRSDYKPSQLRPR